MKIEKKLLNEWKKLRSEGDLTAIAAEARQTGGKLATTGASTVSDAFKNGKCSPELFEVISNFYSNRKQMVESAAQKMQSAA
jgi:hypothetical protein